MENAKTIGYFLNLLEGYSKDGYLNKPYANSTDEDYNLPLAYMVDENDPGNSASGDQILDVINIITREIDSCNACSLCHTRTKAVPGEGVKFPLVMVIGEGPGADEDKSGRPFVGRAGQLLDKMLASIGLSREENCFIANIVKCRPPGNRDPGPEEIASCLQFIERQITALNPKLILLTGRIAAQNLLKLSTSLKDLRGTFHNYVLEGCDPIPALVTYHPSALLRDEALKRPAWEDLKMLKTKLDAMLETRG